MNWCSHSIAPNVLQLCPVGQFETIMEHENLNDQESAQLGIGAVRYQLAISALEAIVDPIGHMKKQLKEDEMLDGMYAIRIAERPEFYQEIAKKALEEIANCT